MPTIKTRDALRTIKTFDRAKTLGQKVKGRAEEVKEYVDEVSNNGYQSENEYAGNAVQSTEARTAKKTVLTFGKTGNWGLKRLRKNIKKAKIKKQTSTFKVKESQQLPPPKRPALPSPKNVEKTAQSTAKASKKAAETAKKAAQATVKAIKATVKAIVAATKAVIATIKDIIAAIAAGGWVAALIIAIIVIIGAIVGAICNVFTPNHKTEKGVTVVDVVKEAKQEFYQEIEDINGDYEYDQCYVIGEPCDPKLAVAVYAVRISGTKHADRFDNKKVKLLKETYSNINQIVTYTTEREATETNLVTQEDGATIPVDTTVIKTDLYIYVSSLTQPQIEQMYAFDDNQRSLLIELLSKDTDELWVALFD